MEKRRSGVQASCQFDSRQDRYQRTSQPASPWMYVVDWVWHLAHMLSLLLVVVGGDVLPTPNLQQA